jgi:hypothetical protein
MTDERDFDQELADDLARDEYDRVVTENEALKAEVARLKDRLADQVELSADLMPPEQDGVLRTENAALRAEVARLVAPIDTARIGEKSGQMITAEVLAMYGLAPDAAMDVASQVLVTLWLAGLQVVKRDARAEVLDEGKDLPGTEGAMLRFLKRLDLEQVRAWINEELARGTGPSARFDVAVSAAAFILAQTIMSVKERGVATKDVLARVPGAVHARIQEAVDAAKPRIVGGTER